MVELFRGENDMRRRRSGVDAEGMKRERRRHRVIATEMLHHGLWLVQITRSEPTPGWTSTSQTYFKMPLYKPALKCS